MSELPTELDPARYVVGRRAVAEALAARTLLEKVFLSYGGEDGPMAELRIAAKRAGITCSVMDRRKFGALEAALGLGRNDAQGVIALRPLRTALTLERLVEDALASNPAPLLLALDGITDPHNLGAIARSAECVGAAGLILPVKFTAPITPAAVKASAGALELLPVARVQRMSETLAQLRASGWRIIGTAIPADASYDAAHTYDGPIIIVIGSEGEGLHPRVQAECDVVVTIPMFGRVASLNASVAAGVVLFEAQRQRKANTN